jgi:hypothetical protein
MCAVREKAQQALLPRGNPIRLCDANDIEAMRSRRLGQCGLELGGVAQKPGF